MQAFLDAEFVTARLKSIKIEDFYLDKKNAFRQGNSKSGFSEPELPNLLNFVPEDVLINITFQWGFSSAIPPLEASNLLNHLSMSFAIILIVGIASTQVQD